MIIVTGNAGLIGRQLVELWKSIDFPHYELSKPELSNLHPIELVKLFQSLRYSRIIHLAAKVPKPPTVPDSVQNSEETRRLDDQIISVAEHTQIPLTYLSGCSLYENNHAYLKTEDSPLNVSISCQYLNSKMIGNFRVQRIPHSLVIRLSAPLSAYLPSSTALMNFFNQLISTNAIRVTGLGNRA